MLSFIYNSCLLFINLLDARAREGEVKVVAFAVARYYKLTLILASAETSINFSHFMFLALLFLFMQQGSDIQEIKSTQYHVIRLCTEISELLVKCFDNLRGKYDTRNRRRGSMPHSILLKIQCKMYLIQQVVYFFKIATIELDLLKFVGSSLESWQNQWSCLLKTLPL